ncbi:MAG: sodium/proline symporter PutP [Clostridia bacterium]|nr:sodium/proline symporter PutP [Clostridia bacterium]
MTDKLDILLAMAGYMLIVVFIGVFFAKRSQESSKSYFLGGRSLGPWVTAMSAEASDMSGWLLMGLPGLAYFNSPAEAIWTAIGLAVGTYVNWLIVSKRLRSYSIVSGDAITVPDFLSNRFQEKKKIILGVSAIFILIFFTVYASSCFVTCGKLFAGLFDADYHTMMLIGAAFVILYTILGGFLAESVSDLMQAIVMIIALVGVLIFGVIEAGGFAEVIQNAKDIPGYLSLTKTATPVLDENGAQIALNGIAQFGQPGSYDWLTILSTLSWGLGYFGIPQVLLRFMAIRKSSELKSSRRIATVWCVISLAAAVMIGIIGRSVFPASATLNSASSAENVFAELSQLLFHPIVAGVIMAGILAATISSSDSYLLIAASAVSKNIFEGIVKKDATDKQVMAVSRVVLILIAVVGAIIAWDEESVIFNVVSFAWAGFGATFGPVILFSLFWKRTNRAGALAGMISGGTMVFIWKLLLKPMGGLWGIYELLPAFVLSSIVIVIASLLTKKPSAEIEEEFEKAKNYKDEVLA